MKRYIFSLLLLLPLFTAQAAAPDDYAARIAELEHQVARLTEQVNILLAQRTLPEAKSQTVYVCSIKAFTDTFRAENTHRGHARLNVLKQCRSKHNEMFCQAKDISCQQY